jgi:hypothetical protein
LSLLPLFEQNILADIAQRAVILKKSTILVFSRYALNDYELAAQRAKGDVIYVVG